MPIRIELTISIKDPKSLRILNQFLRLIDQGQTRLELDHPSPRAPVKKDPTPPKRPGPGTKTGRVWAICDGIFDLMDEVPDINEVMSRGLEEGLHAGTISTQYRKWCEHQEYVEYERALQNVRLTERRDMS